MIIVVVAGLVLGTYAYNNRARMSDAEFAEALARTVEWYRDNRGWWERIKSGEYKQYYQQQYGGRQGFIQ